MQNFYPYAKTKHCALLRSLLVFATLFSTNLLFAQPVISSFSPASGPVGTTVTITGSNFSTTPANNIVFFGAVKAAVTGATSTSLTVTVPTGATYQPITVNTNGLTGYAQKPFNVTFSLNGGLSASSFAKSELATGDTPTETAMADLDGDGKSDLVVLNYGAGSFSVYQNNSTPGSLSFLPKVDYPAGNLSSCLVVADIDGDGKLDLLFGSSTFSTGFWLFRNTSTPGTISFAAKTGIGPGIASSGLFVSDIDGDGKPDVAIPSVTYNKIVSVLRNTSTPGNVSFATKVDFTTGNYSAGTVSMGDLDGDGKPDLIAGYYVSSFSFSILRNTSTPGTISFATTQEVAAQRYSESILIRDLDNDGKNDVIVANGTGSTVVSVFKNTSTTGAISLAGRNDFAADKSPQHVAMNDIDGDGQPEILTANSDTTTFSILKNTTSSGTISFASGLQYQTGDWPWSVQSGDLDGDQKSDIVVVNRGANTISIFSSKSTPTVTGFTPISGGAGTTVTITGTNLDLTTAVTIGGTPVTSFAIVSSNTITAVLAAGSKGTIAVTTLTGTASIDGFGLTPTITSFSPASGPVGTTITITGTNFSNTASDNTVYFGSVKATVVSASATTLSVKVPLGAAYQPISITTNKLTAYSAVPFNITFPTIGATFAANSFSAGIDFPSRSGVYDACTGDVDGDGKNDVITANNFDQTISVFRNTSVNGSVSFAAQIVYPSDYSYSLALGDIDGDGKQDIIIGCSNSIIVYKNNCTPGTIAFTKAGDFYLGNGEADIVVTDLDGDGRSDVIIADNSGITLLKNTSTSTISFDVPVFFTVGYLPGQLSVADLDGDGKPDIAVTSTDNAVAHNGKVSVFRNTTVSGAPFSVSSLAAKIDFVTAKSTNGLIVADLDNDGKKDIVAANSESGTISIFKNTCTPGNISMATKVDYNTGTSTTLISIDDLDGDGKPDLVLPFRYYEVGLMKNTSTTGAISFAPVVKYDNANEPWNSASGDLDGDGKPDLLIANYSGDGFTVYRNQVAEPTVIPTGSNPVTGNIVNKLAIENPVPAFNSTPYVQRHYDVLPYNNAAGATATVTLYFTQQEFDNFNATANHGANLPTGSTDAGGIANLRIYQYHGTSATGLPGSYSGSAVAIDPDDSNIVWNVTTQWWAVTFTINGFSGFFASNASFIYLPPTAPVITANGNTTFCAGGSVTLSSSASAGNQWYKDGQVINGAGGITLMANASGTYTVTATTNGITSPQSNGIAVTVNPIPVKPTITRNGSQLVSSAATGNQWYKDGTAIGSATGSSITPTEAGNYTVKVTANGCASDESDKFNYTITGVIDLNNNQFIKLNPNPVKDKVLLEFNVAGSYLLTVQLIDMQGKICKTFTNQLSGSQLSFAGLNNGVYIANIFTNNQKQRYTMRLVKQ